MGKFIKGARVFHKPTRKWYHVTGTFKCPTHDEAFVAVIEKDSTEEPILKEDLLTTKFRHVYKESDLESDNGVLSVLFPLPK